jgi:SRSO17 transposase
LESLAGAEHKQRALEYTTGLMSGLEHKTGEGIAYLYDEDRQGFQKFIGQLPWDHQPLLRTLAVDVGKDLGEPDGVIVYDPSAFPKKGKKSVGVGKQWCGRLGKVENCQVGIYMAYVTRKEHTLVNTRLYLPKDWANDRGRRKEAGVPSRSSFPPAIGWHWNVGMRRDLPHADGAMTWAVPPVSPGYVDSASIPLGSPRTH